MNEDPESGTAPDDSVWKLEDHQYGGAAFNEEWHYLQLLHRDLIVCLWWCAGNFSRDSENSPKNFAIHVFDDIGEVCSGVQHLVGEGLRNPCRRELRYLLEVGLKACLVVEKNTDLTPAEQLVKFQNSLESSSINMINSLDLHYFDENLRAEFLVEFKRLYGDLSKYVHLSSAQLQETLELQHAGIWRGHLDADQQAELNSILERGYALTLALFLHSLPKWVVGDLMMSSVNGEEGWHYMKSKYIAAIDRNFDYKHERQADLANLIKLREKKISF